PTEVGRATLGCRTNASCCAAAPEAAGSGVAVGIAASAAATAAAAAAIVGLECWLLPGYRCVLFSSCCSAICCWVAALLPRGVWAAAPAPAPPSGAPASSHLRRRQRLAPLLPPPVLARPLPEGGSCHRRCAAALSTATEFSPGA
ncbi:unnamed protein product, partial [Ectocarpus sp. 8 AP-2014]